MSVKPRILLLSNSTMPGTPYMEWSKSVIKQFLDNKPKHIVFIPFAGIRTDWDQYEAKVKAALTEYNIISIHKTKNYLETIGKSDAIIIGGGNTFNLLYKLQENNLLEPIRKKVLEEGVPYVGWSAGSNVAAPDIGSTNDMPIIWPKTDLSLNLVDYNINPHYNEWKPEGHGGETRTDRLNECVHIKKRPIVAISEGLAIKVEGNKHTIVAPDLKLNPDNRVVKIWFNNNNKIDVIEVKFNEDINSVILKKK